MKRIVCVAAAVIFSLLKLTREWQQFHRKTAVTSLQEGLEEWWTLIHSFFAAEATELLSLFKLKATSDATFVVPAIRIIYSILFFWNILFDFSGVKVIKDRKYIQKLWMMP